MALFKKGAAGSKRGQPRKTFMDLHQPAATSIKDVLKSGEHSLGQRNQRCTTPVHAHTALGFKKSQQNTPKRASGSCPHLTAQPRARMGLGRATRSLFSHFPLV
jgi:hypothetical protein